MDSLNTLLRGIFANQISVFLIVGGILFLAARVGYRMGLRLHHAQDEPRSKQAEIVQGSVLGLMSLLLGFTYAMAVQRYDLRKKTVVDEANAIGTAFLRASFLPDASRAESENLLRRYVPLRLDLLKASETPEGLSALESETAKIQQRLWLLVSEAGRQTPNTLINGYAQSLNDMIDMDATRLASLRNHVPGAVWLLLLALTFSGCWFTGYRAGAAARPTKLSLLALPLLITIVITLVSDLDHPTQGLVGLDETSLRDLQQSLGKPSPLP